MLYLKKYKWSTKKNVSVTGFIWLGEEYFCGQDFVAQTQKHAADFDQFKDFVSRLNGQFSIVVQNEKETWATCCHTWSFPLFYKIDNGSFSISDQPEKLQQTNADKEIDAFASSYFLQFGVTPFQQTLNKNIAQIQPGEIIRFKNNSEKVAFDFSFQLHQKQSEKQTPENIATHFRTVFEKYYEQLKDKQILLPLTRGYDSRLLACLLAEFGHKNVLCATWGRKNNSEKQTAQKAADKLGFQYRFIEYNEDLINNFKSTPTFIDYANYSGHYSSMPYLQDYFAIKFLRAKKLINENTVALPGHPGDFLRGAHLNNSILDLKTSELGSALIKTLGTSLPAKPAFKAALQEYLEENRYKHKSISPAEAYEIWDLQERQCKFISNSNQVYSFFGVDVLMPLFDKQSLQFFAGIDARNKNREQLYNKTLEKHFLKKHGIDFDLKQILNQGNSRFQGQKNRLIKAAPHQLKTLYYPMNDGIFYREITYQLRQNIKMKHPVKPHSFNAYIVQWYLHFLVSLSK
nr:asparagine synthase-related protein [uncultured Draconibacterium sp.]